MGVGTVQYSVHACQFIFALMDCIGPLLSIVNPRVHDYD